MRIGELLKTMLYSFFIITTGIVVSMYVFCLIFYPDVSFSLDDIGRILLMALASELPYVIFLSRDELSRKQMLIRFAIHAPVLFAILLFFSHIWDWVDISKATEVAVFFALVAGVYIGVLLITSYRDKKLADKLNDSLKDRYHK